VGILARIKRHAAVAKGNFASMFNEIDIPPLPSAITRLINELNMSEPDVNKLVRLISSEAGILAKLIKTVNSPLFGLRRPATNVRHAITLLGFKHVKSIVLAYATMEGIPKPDSAIFDHEAFWIDSLLKAMFARAMAKRSQVGNLDDTFTATLLNDIALPVLLTAWQEYYEPVVEHWKNSEMRLSDIERKQFGWDHGQAGAWIAQSWNLPEDMVCYIGGHNLEWEKMEELGLSETLAKASWVSALLPSVMKPNGARAHRMMEQAYTRLGIGPEKFSSCLAEVRHAVGEILALFELPLEKCAPVLDQMENLLRERVVE